MSKRKSNKFFAVFSIFFSSIKTYFLYLDQCAKYMAFPILGQLICITFIFLLTYCFNTQKSSIKEMFPFFADDTVFYSAFYIILAPFFIIFMKAVYDYIIAFCSLNLMFYTVSGRKKIKNIDFSANKKVIERKFTSYILLMFIITLLLITPPLIFVSPLIWLFLCLSFQVFSFEDTGALKSISRSIELVKGNIIPTVIMLVLCFAFTYKFLPELFIWTCGKISVISFLIGRIEIFLTILPFDALNDILSIFNITIDPLTIAKNAAEGVISFIITGFTLPFRCCCFTELYKIYDSEKIKSLSKESKEIITRAAGRKRKN